MMNGEKRKLYMPNSERPFVSVFCKNSGEMGECPAIDAAREIDVDYRLVNQDGCKHIFFDSFQDMEFATVAQYLKNVCLRCQKKER